MQVQLSNACPVPLSAKSFVFVVFVQNFVSRGWLRDIWTPETTSLYPFLVSYTCHRGFIDVSSNPSCPQSRHLLGNVSSALDLPPEENLPSCLASLSDEETMSALLNKSSVSIHGVSRSTANLHISHRGVC